MYIHNLCTFDRHHQLSSNSEDDNGSDTIPRPVSEASDITTMLDIEEPAAIDTQ